MSQEKEINKEEIINSFNDFFTSNKNLKKDENEVKKLSLADKFDKERLEYSNKVKQITSKLKNVFEISELMTTIYTERQIAVEYYHYLISLLIKLNKVFKSKWSERWEYYTYKSQVRFPNEAEKKNKIISDLKDLVEKRELIENHSKFIDNTIKTLDNIIYGIKSRVEIEQISRGK